MKCPIDALRLLADLLEAKEYELEILHDRRDREAMEQLWELYAALLEEA